MARAIIVLEDDSDGSVCLKATSPDGAWSKNSDAHKLAYTLSKHFQEITHNVSPMPEPEAA